MNEREIVSPDLASPRFKADPYPFYARLRAEAPVADQVTRQANGMAGDPPRGRGGC